MYLSTKQLIIFSIFYAHSVTFVYNQAIAETYPQQSYNFVEIVQKSAKQIIAFKNLKLASKEDIHVLMEIQNFLPENINSILLDMFTETNSIKCFQDLIYVFRNVKSPDGWSLKMLDAYGKPESGLLLGNVKWLGEYDECLGIYAPPQKNTTVGDFHGKYCNLQIPLKQGNVSLPLFIAVCLPDSCNPSGRIFGSLTNLRLNGSSLNSSERMNFDLGNATLTCKPTTKKLTTAAIAVICLMSLFVFLAVIGSSITAFECYAKEPTTKFSISRTNSSNRPPINDDRESISDADSDVLLIDTGNQIRLPVWLEKCKPFFNCFCIITNGGKILNTTHSEGQIPCLHGIRFLSMTWVILCHSYAFSFTAVRNITETFDFLDHWLFQLILNGFYSVDSFFLLSGFLVAYLFFQHVKNDGKIPWIYFYIHRYIRLTPVYMIVIAFWTTILPFLSSGPLSLDVDIDQNCKVSWWWNLLYINNFQPSTDQCMAWAWYLANDMQFYIISPLLLVTLWRWPKIGYSLCGLFMSVTIISNFIITYEYDLIAGLGNVIDEAKNGQEDFMKRWTNFFDKLYIKPYTRVGPYLVGFLLAYYLHKRKQNNSSKLGRITLLIGWIIASGITFSCLFGLYHQKPTLVASSFYNSLNHLGFALGLAWVIFICITGQGDIVNNILSWKAWIPLSRVTYCAYLIHPIVLLAYYSTVRRMIEFNHVNMVLFYLSFLTISYASAGMASLLFESPVIRLERLLRDKLSP